jgi:hypothetical protein
MRRRQDKGGLYGKDGQLLRSYNLCQLPKTKSSLFRRV